MKTTRLIPSFLIATLLLMPSLHAQQQRRRQQGRSDGVGLPERIAPVPQKPAQPPVQPPLPATDAPVAADASGLPDKDAAPAGVNPAPSAVNASAAAKEPPTPVKGGIMLNFQGASLTDVLNYLSEAAGFVILQDAPIPGTVNVVSKQPVTPDEAVDLLNAVLAEKGFTAIRSERILKIVSRKDALKRDIPVRMGSNPDQIPRRDEMVTQILPLRYGEAAKLVENLRPLLPDNATISANESSNAIIMTDSLTNIRRIAQIIQAIDTSVASISTIHIYPLEYADAKELATLVTSLFSPATSTNNQNGGRGGRGGGGGGFFGQFGGFGGPGGPGGGGGQAPQSEAKQAEARVVAVADEQSNSLVVSASAEYIPLITDVVSKLDTSGTEVSETKIFELQHADSVETATTLTTLYGDTTTQGNQNQNRGNRGPGGFGGFGQPQSSSSQKSTRALQQAKVVAVGDPRTNSLLVSASRDMMSSIALTIGRLDASDAKKQHVYIYALQHADADNVATVLRGMLGDTSAQTSASQSGSSRLTTRSANGAALDTSEFSGSNSGRGGGR